MNELIKVQTNDNFEQIVSARDLHEALAIGKDFTTWFKQQIERLGLVEGTDYSLLTNFKCKGRGGHNKTDYLISADMATQIAMKSIRNQYSSDIVSYL